MSKVQDVFIENWLGKSLPELVKWGDHVHYFESGEFVLSYCGNEKKCVHLFCKWRRRRLYYFQTAEDECISYLKMEKLSALVKWKKTFTLEKWRMHVRLRRYPIVASEIRCPISHRERGARFQKEEKERAKLTITQHFGVFLKKDKGHMIEDNSRKFYFLEEEVSYCLDGRTDSKAKMSPGFPKSWSII